MSSNLAFPVSTHREFEKLAASGFEVDVGEMLLFETRALYNTVLVGPNRMLYFSMETSGYKYKPCTCHNCDHKSSYFSQLHLDSGTLRMDVARSVSGSDKKCARRADPVQPRRGEQKEIPGQPSLRYIDHSGESRPGQTRRQLGPAYDDRAYVKQTSSFLSRQRNNGLGLHLPPFQNTSSRSSPSFQLSAISP